MRCPRQQWSCCTLWQQAQCRILMVCSEPCSEVTLSHTWQHCYKHLSFIQYLIVSSISSLNIQKPFAVAKIFTTPAFSCKTSSGVGASCLQCCYSHHSSFWGWLYRTSGASSLSHWCSKWWLQALVPFLRTERGETSWMDFKNLFLCMVIGFISLLKSVFWTK